MIFSSVVLPQPLGPTIERNSRLWTSNVTSCKAKNEPFLVGNVLLSSVQLTAVLLVIGYPLSARTALA